MEDLLCPYTAPQIKGDFGCSNAKEIVRRGGAEIACNLPEAHRRCCALHSMIKTAALKVMDLQDDLLTLPHSVLVKIQYGGLLGLQKLVDDDEQRTSIADITMLVTVVLERYITPENIPLESVCETIIEYKAQRRCKR